MEGRGGGGGEGEERCGGGGVERRRRDGEGGGEEEERWRWKGITSNQSQMRAFSLPHGLKSHYRKKERDCLWKGL